MGTGSRKPGLPDVLTCSGHGGLPIKSPDVSKKPRCFVTAKLKRTRPSLIDNFFGKSVPLLIR
jgi:hypothetical protein